MEICSAEDILMFINNQGRIYFGQMAQGDRAATQSEIDDYNLNQARATQLDLINKGFNNQAYGLVAFKGTTFQADEESRARLLSTLAAWTVTTLPAGFFWTDSSNNPVPMTYAELQNLLATGAGQFFSAFQHLQIQKAAVNNATTIAQIQAVVW